MNADRLPPALEGFQTILSVGSDDPSVSLGILNATGITKKTEELFHSADVAELKASLQAAEDDPPNRLG